MLMVLLFHIAQGTTGQVNAHINDLLLTSFPSHIDQFFGYGVIIVVGQMSLLVFPAGKTHGFKLERLLRNISLLVIPAAKELH